MERQNLNQLAREIHKTAVEHGWWENPPSFGEVVALCHSELSEALEEYRNENPMEWYECMDYECPCDGETCASWDHAENKCAYNRRKDKPEGIAVEMADCLIRILDWAAYAGVDMEGIVRRKMAYNNTRPYRHGGKKL